MTIVFVTHNVREAVRLAQRVVLLSSRPGRVAQEYPIDIGAAAPDRGARRRRAGRPHHRGPQPRDPQARHRRLPPSPPQRGGPRMTAPVIETERAGAELSEGLDALELGPVEPRTPRWRRVVDSGLPAVVGPRRSCSDLGARHPGQGPGQPAQPGRGLRLAPGQLAAGAHPGGRRARASSAAASASCFSVADRHADRPAALPRPPAAPGLRPDHHRAAVDAVGGLGARWRSCGSRCPRARSTSSSSWAPSRRSSTARSAASTRCRRSTPGSAHVLGARGLLAGPARAAAGGAARLHRRPQAGLGVLLALAHGGRAHRHQLDLRPGPRPAARPVAAAVRHPRACSPASSRSSSSASRSTCWSSARSSARCSSAAACWSPAPDRTRARGRP